MENTLDKILGKPNDYKLCKGCSLPNWYENELCHNCHKKRFGKIGEGIADWVQEEYKFWREEEKYSENEIDNIEVSV